METDFIYWSHKLPRGVEVAEICGGEDKSPALWRAMALQLLAEHSYDGSRTIGHYASGAPFFEGEERIRVSLTHTKHFMAVAWLPEAHEAITDSFDSRYALGIDAERADRGQVLKIRERFVAEAELSMVTADDVAGNVLLWTIKEALYKAALTPGLDFRVAIRVTLLPGLKSKAPGRAEVLTDGRWLSFSLYSWESEGHILTVALHNQ